LTASSVNSSGAANNAAPLNMTPENANNDPISTEIVCPGGSVRMLSAIIEMTMVCPPAVRKTSNARRFRNCDKIGVEPTDGSNDSHRYLFTRRDHGSDHELQRQAHRHTDQHLAQER
jgi:hypothetical protein